jgi:CSLREA domain-containing protein
MQAGGFRINKGSSVQKNKLIQSSLVIVICGLIGCLAPLRAGAATFTVNNTNDSGAGSLRQAILDANDEGANPGADTIDATGVTGNITLTSGELAISSDITINGPTGGTLTVSGNNASRVFNITTGTVALNDLTITGGNADLGGGIEKDGTGDLTLTDMTFSSNTTTGGGGALYVIAGHVTATNCSFTGNSSNFAGAIYSAGTLDLGTCTISNNTAAVQGGALFNDGTATIDLSTIDTNSTTGPGGANEGGGLFNSTGHDLTVTNSTISNNQSDFGGGVENFGTVSFTNCTFSANSATNDGGGLRNMGTGTVSNCTFFGNSAGGGFGGAISNGNTLNIDNSIIANSTGTNVSGGVTSLGYNLSSDSTGPADVTDIVNTDPQLGPLQDNGGPTLTYEPLPGSPVIDAGNSTEEADQRGLPRLVDFQAIANASGGNGSDIGAVEVQDSVQSGSTLTVNTTADSDDGACTVADCTLREAINAANTAGGGTIDFDPSVSGTINLGKTGLPDLTTNITITGPGSSILTVDGFFGNFHIFNIPGGVTASISGLTLTDVDFGGDFSGSSVQGGAIFNAGNLTLTDIAATTNRVENFGFGDAAGGAITNTGTLTANNCNFGGNEADATEGLLPGMARGGAIFNTGTLTLNDTLFITNFAVGADGSFSDGGPGLGGAIYSSGVLRITRGSLDGNATVGGDAASGGLLPGHDAVMNSVVFAPAGGDAQGGAIYSTASLTMSGASLSENFTSPGFGAFTFFASGPDGMSEGGAVYSTKTAGISGTTFDSNECDSGFSIGPSNGGAIASTITGTLIIVTSTLTNNDADVGGAISSPGALTANNNSFATNSAGLGAGLYVGESVTSGSPTTAAHTVNTCTLAANSASSGAAIDVESGFSLTINTSTISGNGAASGGGIANLGTLNVNRSTLFGNTAAGAGGGLWNTGTATLTNSTVSGNAATTQGGGIYNSDTLTLGSCTVTLNRAYQGGGAFENSGATTTGNTIVAGNTLSNSGGSGPDVNGTFTSTGYNLIGIGDGSSGLTDGVTNDHVGTAATPIDPKLAALANNGGVTQTHALLRHSPALDSGDPNAPAVDQRNLARPKDGDGDGIAAKDIGAFEQQTPLNTAPVARDDSYSTYQDIAISPAAPGVLSNDTDAQHDVLTPQLLSSTAHGQLTLRANGSFTYTPTAGFSGVDTFTYRLSDGDLTGNTATVTINVMATFRIIGRVSNGSGQAIPNVAVTRTGPAGPGSLMVLSNSAGYYVFTKVPVSTQVVKPSLSGTTFTPTQRTVNVTNADVTDQNFVGNGGFNISGRITGPSGAALVGIRVTRSGTPSGSGLTVITNTAGYYIFTGVLPGSYVVAPTEPGYTFTPSSRSVTITNADIIGQNFSGRNGYILQGRVYRKDGTALGGVTLTLSNSATATTNSSGYYTFYSVAPGSYTLTPSFGTFTFDPVSRSVTVTNADISGLNFVGRNGATVTGRIATSTGVGIAGAMVQLDSGPTVTTNGAGYYTINDVPDGQHTLTPSKSGLTFTPPTKTVTITNGADATGQNFIGTG